MLQRTKLLGGFPTPGIEMFLSNLKPHRSFAFGVCLILVLLVQWPAQTENAADAARIELQKDSFCSLEWSIAEFKWNFNRQFTELLFQAQQARKASGNHLVTIQIAQVLEHALAQARSAVSVQEIEECLLTFYRSAGLTNKFLTLRDELQTRNPNRIVLAPERRFLEHLPNQPAETATP
jgi:hypothetical protein